MSNRPPQGARSWDLFSDASGFPVFLQCQKKYFVSFLGGFRDLWLWTGGWDRIGSNGGSNGSTERIDRRNESTDGTDRTTERALGVGRGWMEAQESCSWRWKYSAELRQKKTNNKKKKVHARFWVLTEPSMEVFRWAAPKKKQGEKKKVHVRFWART